MDILQPLDVETLSRTGVVGRWNHVHLGVLLHSYTFAEQARDRSWRADGIERWR